jgi:atypical dual specificity phosphatase
MAVEARGRPGAAARRKAKEAAVGAAARMLFYPTLLYNVVLLLQLGMRIKW